MMTMSQDDKLPENPASPWIGYDDDDERNIDMSQMRTPMDPAQTQPSSSMPELQADKVGHAVPLVSATKGFVYFIETEDGQFIKIGFSVNVHRRMGQIALLAPSRLIGFFPASPQTEYWIHRKFALSRHVGEWFRSSMELREFIDSLGLITDTLEAASPEPPSRHSAEPSDPDILNAAALMGRKGGKKKAKMDPEQARQIRSAGGKARWGKKK